MLQDSGGSRSGSDNEQSECSDDDETLREAGSGKRSRKLAGSKHKSDTVLQQDNPKKSGGSSGEGSGAGSGNGPVQPKPLMVTPDQLRALQKPGTSLVFKPGKNKFGIAQGLDIATLNAFLRSNHKPASHRANKNQRAPARTLSKI